MKKLLIDELREKHDLSERAAGRAVDQVFGAVDTLVRGGQAVSVPRFGKFQMKRTAPRTGRNFQTGETVEVAARDVIGFKPSKKT